MSFKLSPACSDKQLNSLGTSHKGEERSSAHRSAQQHCSAVRHEDLPVCPSANSKVQRKIIVAHCWYDADGGETEVTGEKPILVSICPT